MTSTAVITTQPVNPQLAAWFAPVLTHGSRWCAPNLDTTCAFLRVGELELPLTINEAQWDNSWICSPFNHYVTYARSEIRSATSGVVALPAGLILGGLGAWFRRTDFNRVVMLNNWLMATNPWPQWDARHLPAALAALGKRWPDHAWVFRSLTCRADASLLEALAGAGARLIPSRQIWWYPPESAKVKHSRDFQQDARLLGRSDLERLSTDGLCESDFFALTQLYHQLYLEKYSFNNPQYTSEWLRHLWRERLLQFTALREPGGSLVGVEACGIINGTMISPIVGYELSRPQKMGLYRRLAAVPVLAAREKRVPLNLSAGVGRFKALRGGEPELEYLAVVDAHLPARRRRSWRIIELVSRRVLAPLVRRWQL